MKAPHSQLRMASQRTLDDATLSVIIGRQHDLSSCKYLVSKLESTKNKMNLKNSVRLLERNEIVLTAIRKMDAEIQDAGKPSCGNASRLRLQHILELNANLGELNRIFTTLSN